jgi:DNA polymerase III alpha subunit (gram-positive type)
MKPHYLFFDTETTGLPTDYNAHHSEVDNFPRLVQLAAMLTDKKGNLLHAFSVFIKPNGYEIPSGMIHGISHEQALDLGIELKEALQAFEELLKVAKCLVCHNYNFDSKIIASEFYRAGYENVANLIRAKDFVCTMLSTVDFCALPGKVGFKYPRLSELYYAVFEEDFEGAHDAFADVKATKKCFFELLKRNVLCLQY